MTRRFWEFGPKEAAGDVLAALQVFCEPDKGVEDYIVIPRGILKTMNSSELDYLSKNFSEVIGLRIPITDSQNKALCIFALAQRIGFLEKYDHFLFNGDEFELIEDKLVDQLSLTVKNLCESAEEISDFSEIVHSQIGKLSELSQHLPTSELGIRLEKDIKRAAAEYLYLRSFMFSGKGFSQGQLRSLGIASALIGMWSVTLDQKMKTFFFESEDFDEVINRVDKIIKKVQYPNRRKIAPDFDSEFWPTLFVATSAWFLRFALSVKNRRDLSRELMPCLVRSIELALQASALYQGKGEFDPISGDFLFEGKRIYGCGSLVNKLEERRIKLQNLSQEEIEDLITGIQKLLKIRNHSSLAHGVLDIDTEFFDEMFSQAKSFVEEVIDKDLSNDFYFFFSKMRTPRLRDGLRAVFCSGEFPAFER